MRIDKRKNVYSTYKHIEVVDDREIVKLYQLNKLSASKFRASLR